MEVNGMIKNREDDYRTGREPGFGDKGRHPNGVAILLSNIDIE